jgi:uncharacterized membrane protein
MEIGFVRNLPPELATLLVGALPLIELRGAIPLGLAMGLSFGDAYLWACLGNLIPVLPLLWWFQPVAARLRRFPLWRKAFEWLSDRVSRRGQFIERYEALGLMLFVMVPIPGTGVWTGCVAASLFNLPIRLALPALVAGVLGAGGLVLLAIQLGLTFFYLTFGPRA